MDFVAPPLLGYAGGAGLLEYTGAGAEAGLGTSDDPIMMSSSDEDEGDPESPRELPTAVPVIELKAIRTRKDRDGIGYDRDLKMLNFSVHVLRATNSQATTT